MEKPKNGKKTLGRRKIEIKKIEKKANLQVAFTKRRSGLFRKASELAILCGAEMAILVQSPAHKLYAFGHPSVGALIGRVSPSPGAEGRCVDDGRIKYEAAIKMLEMEKRRAEEYDQAINGGGCWWEDSCEGLELDQLMGFLKALEDFGDMVQERLDHFDKLAASSSNMRAHHLNAHALIFPTNQIHQIFD